MILYTLVFLSGFAFGYAVHHAYTHHLIGPLTLTQVRDKIDMRAAVHEAGHALVSLHNPFLNRIESVEIDKDIKTHGNGKCRVETIFRIDNANIGDVRWHELAFTLGGLAAELIEMHRFRSGCSKDDLEKAKAIVVDILYISATHTSLTPVPPWKHIESNGLFKPSQTFKSLSPEEALIMDMGYARARAIIVQNRDSFNRITHALLEKRHLDHDEVKALFSRV